MAHRALALVTALNLLALAVYLVGYSTLQRPGAHPDCFAGFANTHRHQ